MKNDIVLQAIIDELEISYKNTALLEKEVERKFEDLKKAQAALVVARNRLMESKNIPVRDRIVECINKMESCGLETKDMGQILKVQFSKFNRPVI